MIYNFNESKVPAISQVGGKAKALIEMTSAGFNVPGGIVLSVDFFGTWLQKVKSSKEYVKVLNNTTKDNCDSLKALAMTMRFNDMQKLTIEKNMDRIKGDVFAVRSSSPEEDMAGTSFAGMYETYLGIRREEIEKTVALAFSSCFDYRVMEYKKNNGFSLADTAIAIIIQKQVSSDVSGVGFSLNPLNNAFDEIVINASFGLGEAIVSGIVTPDMYIYDVASEKIIEKKINKKEIGLWLNSQGGIEERVNLNKEECALSDAQILELSTLIKNCEKYYKVPTDIEWAYEKGRLYLLQSRPITTYIPFFEELLTKPNESKRFYIDLLVLTQGFNEPMSVLGMDMWSKMVEVTKGCLLTPHPNGTAPVIHGREYLSVTAYQKILGKKNGKKILDTYDGNIKKIFNAIDLNDNTFVGKPDGTKGFFWKALKLALPMLPAMFKSLFADHKKMIVDYHKFADVYMSDMNRLNKSDDFQETSSYMIESLNFLMGKVSLIFAGLMAQQSIKKIFKGDDVESELIALNMDLEGNPTSEMGHLLFDMACSSDFKDVTSREDFVLKAQKREYSKDFMKLYDEFIDKYSVRGFREIDVASKRIYEDIGMIYDKLIELNTDENQILSVKARRDEAYKKLLDAAEKKGKTKKFIKSAEKLKATLGYREYPKYLIVYAYSRLHKVCLDIAEDFVKDGRLEEVYQIFDLKVDEISSAQKNKDFDLMAAREKNLEGYKKVEHISEWPLVIDSRGKIYKPKLEIKDGDIVGDSIAPGVIKGKAKVLQSPYEKPLYPGEILIARATEPSWTPIFTNAAGVVMEIGGPLQHGGIIAREYGIPCVSGLIGIMDIIKDGDLLEVDGYNGIVRLVEAEE